MKNSWIRCGIAAALSFGASAALGNAFSGPNPDTQNLTWNGFSNGSVGVSVSTNSGANFSGVNAGQFQGFFDGEGNGISADDFFRFFCIDLGEFVDGNPNPYTRSLGVPDATNAAELTRLFDQYYPNPATGTYYAGGAQTNFGNFANANDSAAFQLAVWEIWFDTDDNLSLSGGSFRATGPSAVISEAQAELNFVHAGSGTAAGWTLYEFTNQGKQDYLSVEHSGPLKTVPEPGTLILLGVGALAAWGTSKHHRKTA
ncbi:MAG: PEP-CTERM sorting domain-containing protein [Betaproteobacteria bacterium]|nr:MAG: PEP-CTERM sorting domain-containing protein [Betaproteobacteria bacterium]